MKIKGLLFVILLFAITYPETIFGYSTVYPTGTTIYHPAKADEGYTIYTASSLGQILLINMNGEVVHYWKTPSPYIEFGYAKPLTNGNLLVFYRINGKPALGYRGVVELDWNSNPVWEFHVLGDNSVHHDFERLESGNTLILCRDYRDVPEISPNTILDDYIIEVNPEGEIVWEWRTSQHFDEFGFGTEAKEMISKRGGDWAHTNSVQSLPGNTLGDSQFQQGNILVSQRETNVIFIIDKTSGQIVWKIGPDDNLTIGQHDAKMIPEGLPGASNILVFDNGGVAGYPQQGRLYSRVIEIDSISKKIVWEYHANESGNILISFFSAFISGEQRLPNGNTLIVEGLTGRFFEVTVDGEIVWEYIKPFFKENKSNIAYRVSRVHKNWMLGQPQKGNIR